VRNSTLTPSDQEIYKADEDNNRRANVASTFISDAYDSPKLSSFAGTLYSSLRTYIQNLESRITVSISPSSEENTFADKRKYKIRGMPRNTREIIALIFFLPMLPCLLKAEAILYLDLEVERRNRPFEDRVKLNSFLRNRNQLLLWLGEQNDRWLYGHFAQEIRKTILAIKYVTERPNPARRPQRKRGYADHGTLLPAHEWQERFDWSLTEQMLQVEEEDHITVVLSFSELTFYNQWSDN